VYVVLLPNRYVKRSRRCRAMHKLRHYAGFVNIAAIVQQIDLEIERLGRIRAIIAELSHPRRAKTSKKRGQTELERPTSKLDPDPGPKLIVLPPKVKREYRPRLKALPRELGALAASVPEKPVFVPRVRVVASPVRQFVSAGSHTEALELAVRRNPAAAGLLSLTPSDHGRQLRSIQMLNGMQNLEDLCEHVIASGSLTPYGSGGRRRIVVFPQHRLP
jgi:hypothetical protein